MRIFSGKMVLLGFLMLVLVCGLAIDAPAQKKKKKKATQPLPMPTPVQTTPQNNEPAVVGRSTDYADLEDYFPRNDGGAPATTTNNRATPADNTQAAVSAASPELEELTRQVRDLAGRIDSMDAKQKLLLDLELLNRAEQRAENLRGKLMDSTDKESAIKVRLTEVDADMTDQGIARKLAFSGSLRPEEARENLRKTLQAEKDRLTLQMTQLQNNRAALETSLQNADTLVEKLRLKLEKAIDDQLQETPAKKPE
jgi:predicted GNAT family acetyltransferase